MKVIAMLFAGLVAFSAAATAGTIEMDVNGLVCAFCAQGIEKKLRSFPATADVVVSLEQRLVAVSTGDDRDIGDKELRDALTDAGYTVTSIRRESESIDAVRTRLKEGQEMIAPLNRSFGMALAAMTASAGTLVCCVLPAVMVAFGAGAALAGLVTAVPQLVWLSEHKALVFGVAAIALAIAGVNLWHARRLPCPIDPTQARACARLRRITVVLYSFALLGFVTGGFFAFVLPALGRR